VQPEHGDPDRAGGDEQQRVGDALQGRVAFHAEAQQPSAGQADEHGDAVQDDEQGDVRRLPGQDGARGLRGFRVVRAVDP
jgi:hypothetical protein